MQLRAASSGSSLKWYEIRQIRYTTIMVCMRAYENNGNLNCLREDKVWPMNSITNDKAKLSSDNRDV